MKECIDFNNFSYIMVSDFCHDTAAQIAAAVSLDFGPHPVRLPDYAFASSCPQLDPDDHNVDIRRVYADSEFWFGIKCFQNPFDSTGVIVLVDYYGGGCTQCFGANDCHSILQIETMLKKALKDAVNANGYGSLRSNEYILVETIKD